MKFQIDPGVVFKLGEDLVSDDVQALVELVKNAYDADATYARVSVNTRELARLDLLEVTAPGYLTVDDDGVGMNRRDVEQGWLFIATSAKRTMKELHQKTARGRTPLGDKGLGRLGAQRLGREIEIATKVASEQQELVVSFSWDDFLRADSLETVTVRDKRRTASRAHGTRITIAGLNDPEHWRESINHLQAELSRMISPYEDIQNFRVVAEIDGSPLDLLSMTKRVREAARVHYDLAFDGQTLRITGRARLAFFRPQPARQIEEFLRLTSEDGGEAFRQFLLGRPGAGGFTLKAERGSWFVRFSRDISLEGLGPVQAMVAPGELASPGPFRGEIDGFSLAAGDEEAIEVFGSLSEYRRYIRDLSGVRIYRDGFAVRTDKDWLGLSSQITRGRSFSTLRPDTTIGYVSISAEDNAVLIETTDREGFLQTPYYRNFTKLFEEFVKWSGEVQTFLARGWVDYRKSLDRESAAVADSSPEAVSSEITRTVAAAQPLRADLDRVRTELADAISAGDDQRLANTLAEATSVLATVESYLAALDTVSAKTRVIVSEVGALREQLEVAAETMALGLTAEALSHEMFNIADALASRTDSIAKHLRKERLDDGELTRYVEHVRSTTRSLRKELSHFAPALRFVRDRRETIDIAGFIREQADYYNARWAGKITAEVDVKRNFSVRISRGKLGQITDNLLLNSEYWATRGSPERASVAITVRSPYLTVSDSGPGVDPTVVETLFDPFVTRKPRGVGRGLGLYVVSQLLESEGCSIELGGKRDSAGRLHEFVVDLAAILDE